MLVKDWLSVIKDDRAVRVVTSTITMSAAKSSIERDFGDYELKSVEQDKDTGRLILYISKYKKCDSYRTKKVRRYLTEYEKGYYAALHGGVSTDYIVENQSYCMGTKECESCICGGDKRKCDFYLTK